MKSKIMVFGGNLFEKQNVFHGQGFLKIIQNFRFKVG